MNNKLNDSLFRTLEVDITPKRLTDKEEGQKRHT